MTKEDLEKLGIIHLNSKVFPNRFFMPYVGDVDLLEPYKLADIYETVYEAGRKAGFKEGQEKKIEEFKDFLNL